MTDMQVGDPNYPGFKLPAVINPPDALCFVVPVPNDPAHISAFLGALYELTQWISWQRDTLKRGKDAATVWRNIWVKLAAQSCNPPVTSIGTDGGEDFMIRQNPTNPCLLESSVDGVTWCAWADISKCLPAGNQPAGGAPQPPAGGCQIYHTNMQANSVFLIPTPVSTGDTIELLNWSGAVHDGQLIPWFCADGGEFYAGNCTGIFQPSQPLDPEPGYFHGATVVQLGPTFYQLRPGVVFTVPAGVVNQQPTIQANLQLATASGSFDYDVKVCNNAPATWSHTFDFTTSPQGWTNWGGIVCPGDVLGVWQPGVGWNSTDEPLCSSQYNRGVGLSVSLPSRTITDIQVTGNFTPGDYDGHGDPVQFAATDSVVLISLVPGSTVNGTNVTVDGHVSAPATTHLYIEWRACHSFVAYSGVALITKIVVSGLGTDPF